MRNPLLRYSSIFVLLTLILLKLCFFVWALSSFASLPFSEGDFHGNYQYRELTPETPGFTKEARTLPFMFSHFDGQWYQQIAENGYNPRALWEEPRNIVFYPLYPGALALMHFLIHNVELSSFLIANIFSLCGLFLFWKLSAFELGSRESWWALVGILCLPMGVFWHASYTEGLFLLLSVGSIYAARTKRHAWAGVLAGLATLTKVQGVLLLPALLVEHYLQYRSDGKSPISHYVRNALWLLLVPLALTSFFLYMYFLTGDFWASIEAQKVFGGGRVLGFRPDVLWDTLMNLAPQHTYRNSPVDAVITLVWFLLLILGVRTIRFSYWIFAMCALILPLSSWSIMSMGRYSLVAFPVIWIILGWTEGRWYVRVPILLCGGALMIYFSQQFIHHYWVG